MATAIAIAWMKNLFAAVMMAGIYGLLSASFFVAMDAVDVAFTEAAVGAGVAPLLMLATIKLVGKQEKAGEGRPLLALLVVSITGALLLMATTDMPHFGSPDAPVHQHVAPQYLQESGEKIGIPNVVTSVLASYRGFDTLGEVAVIFTAGIGVMSILMVAGPITASGQPSAAQTGMREQMILRIVGKILIPPILLFGLYVQFHGDYSPGGGFQAGVIFATGIILYVMLYGLNATKQVISEALVRFLAACGLLLYGSVGVVCLLAGRNFLDYNALASDPVAGQHLGILVIELGVGITVASVMIAIFYSFSGWYGTLASASGQYESKQQPSTDESSS